jgi:hypothetical protein
MIMMTTEEEQRNDEKIQQNQKQYESVKISSNRDVTIMASCRNFSCSELSCDSVIFVRRLTAHVL